MPAHVEWLVGLVRLGATDYGDKYEAVFFLDGHGTHVTVRGACGRPPTRFERRMVALKCYAAGFRRYDWEHNGRTVCGAILSDGRLTIE